MTSTGGKNEESNEQKAVIDSTLREAILSLHHNVPLMEQQLGDICDLRARLVKKEREITETIIQAKTMLTLVSKQLLFEEGSASLIENLIEGGEEERKSDRHLRELAIAKKEDEDSVPLVDSTETLNESTVADLTIQQLKLTFTMKQNSAEKELTRTRIEQDRVCGEIIGFDGALRLFNTSIEGNREVLKGCEAEQVALVERKSALEKELESLGHKYREMNTGLMGQSEDDSNLILQSIRDNPINTGAVNSPSPLLQKYVSAATALSAIAPEVSALTLRMSELELENDNHALQADELREQMKCARESNGQLLVEEERLTKVLQECQSQTLRLDTTIRDDLIAAMRWCQLESHGLYCPTVLTAPLILLLFQDYCRRHVPCKPLVLERCEMSDVVIIDRLRRCKCPDHAAYVANEPPECKFRPIELKSVSYSLQEVLEAGYSLEEMSARSVLSLRAKGCSAHELKQIRFSPDLLHQ
jgi:hypothetical protein